MQDHEYYMQRALALAERGRYTVSPNPMVGAIIVKNQQIIGEGAHLRAGEPHAEIHALNMAGKEANGATLYVTLEPCCHTGRTPPCTTALIAAGIKCVYMATIDPNPKIAGHGMRQLQKAGIDVTVGLLQEEAKAQNEIFFHAITNQKPWIIAKWAMSLDGKTVASAEDARFISSSNHTHATTHALRQQVDAILIGSNTAKKDNPRLTARQINHDTPCQKQPIRFVLTKAGDVPLDLTLFYPEQPGRTIILTTDAVTGDTKQQLDARQIEYWILPKDQDGDIDLKALSALLFQKQIHSVLVEGGMQTLEKFFQSQLVNRVYAYIAPLIVGNMPKKQALKNITLTHQSTDLIMTGLL